MPFEVASKGKFCQSSDSFRIFEVFWRDNEIIAAAVTKITQDIRYLIIRNFQFDEFDFEFVTILKTTTSKFPAESICFE